MHFNYPVDKDAPHSFTDVGLMLHILYFRLIFNFSCQIVFHYVASKFNHILWIWRIVHITIKHSFMQIMINPLVEMLAHIFHIFLKVFNRVFDLFESFYGCVLFCGRWLLAASYTLSTDMQCILSSNIASGAPFHILRPRLWHRSSLRVNYKSLLFLVAEDMLESVGNQSTSFAGISISLSSIHAVRFLRNMLHWLAYSGTLTIPVSNRPILQFCVSDYFCLFWLFATCSIF